MDDNGRIDFSNFVAKAPVNLRVAEHPYLHLRDDEGCILTRDIADLAKLKFILDACGTNAARANPDANTAPNPHGS